MTVQLRPRRRTATVLTLVIASVVTGCGGGVGGSGQDARSAPSTSSQPSLFPAPSSTAPATPGATSRPDVAPAALPRGGQTIFPRYRLVGYAGSPFSAALGRLGTGSLDARGREIERRARAYRGSGEILPVFELVATMATSFPGPGRMYRTRVGDAVVQRYLAAARRHRALLLLNIQPGRADFRTEVRAYERWLREPDVGLALDPEWAVDPGTVPGQVYGHTTGGELDAVARYLSGLVRRFRLPEKALVFHQVAASVVRSQQQLRAHPGVAVIKSVDGIGAPGSKRATWRRLVAGMPAHFHAGFKLFFSEDQRSGHLMTPAEVLALRPTPTYVMYE